jgi:hypothetical protein
MPNAQEGRVYAQVLRGKCHWKFTKAELPFWEETGFTVVDVTGNEPEIGDDFDGVTFIPAPPPLVIPPIDTSDLNNANKLLKAICIYFGGLAGKTPAEIRAGIKAVYDSLP